MTQRDRPKTAGVLCPRGGTAGGGGGHRHRLWLLRSCTPRGIQLPFTVPLSGALAAGAAERARLAPWRRALAAGPFPRGRGRTRAPRGHRRCAVQRGASSPPGGRHAEPGMTSSLEALPGRPAPRLLPAGLARCRETQPSALRGLAEVPPGVAVRGAG